MRELAHAELAPHARPGTDYVIIVRLATAERSWGDLVEDMGKALGYLHRKMDGGGKSDKSKSRGRGNAPARPRQPGLKAATGDRS